MELDQLIYAVTTRKRNRPPDPYAQTRLPRPEKQTKVFKRWQRWRRRYLRRGGLRITDRDRKKICACGTPKNKTMAMCYECKDAWTLVKKRFQKTALHNDAAKRYEPQPLRIYTIPGPLFKAKKFVEDVSNWQENAVRALEDG